jgi:uncharacterized membrane protein
MFWDQFAARADHAIELVGVLLLVVGALLASSVFVLRMLRGVLFNDAYHQLRADLGRAILLGLEFLAIADIIGTIAKPATAERVSRTMIAEPDMTADVHPASRRRSAGSITGAGPRQMACRPRAGLPVPPARG